jgi:spore coat polysaccharide biosynthesis protein SpsF (cytidylyltransferase family)
MGLLDFGIVVCSRTHSQRLPRKPFQNINGTPLIEHLVRNLQKSDIPIVIAIPDDQVSDYFYLQDLKNVTLVSGFCEDPLARMAKASLKFKNVIRITHDKIIIRPKDIQYAIEVYKSKKADYLYSSKFIPGTGFEIIDSELLRLASDKYKSVEFIGYAARSLCKRPIKFNPNHPSGDYRLLIDYPNDIQLFELLLCQLGNDASFESIINYLDGHSDIKKINKLPRVSVYTCAYNAQEFIDKCMDSVSCQSIFNDCEYIIIDDYSSDKTIEHIAKFACKYQNVRWIRNHENIGLASSSNIALKQSKADYIMRLDADDYLIPQNALLRMLNSISDSSYDIVYPDNYYGTINRIQSGDECHHVGGAIFDKRAINHIKFTDGLRGYEGLDLWVRAKGQLKLGYLKKPMFFYRQHGGSLSKNNIIKRAALKQEILEKV